MTLTVQGVYGDAQGCGDHPLSGVTDEEIAGAETIIALGSCSCYEGTPDYKHCGSYCDSGSFALGKLADGRFVVVRESSDSTGHGCRCSGSLDIYPTLEEAERLGLTQTERDARNASKETR